MRILNARCGELLHRQQRLHAENVAVQVVVPEVTASTNTIIIVSIGGRSVKVSANTVQSNNGLPLNCEIYDWFDVRRLKYLHTA